MKSTFRKLAPLEIAVPSHRLYKMKVTLTLLEEIVILHHKYLKDDVANNEHQWSCQDKSDQTSVGFYKDLCYKISLYLAVPCFKFLEI